MPFGRGRRFAFDNSLPDTLLGGWQLNGITTLRGGTPFTLTLAASFANTGHARPNLYRDLRLGRDERMLARYFDTATFRDAALDAQWAREFHFGTAGRNIRRGPGAANFDLSLFKKFPLRLLGECGEVQFRAEAFNRPQFDNPNNRVDLPQGGSITGLRSNMREWQFGLKILF